MILKKRAALSNWHVITLFGAFLYLAYSFALLFDGRPNADEGWYLYAGRLVFQGAMPYRDFAYTQMPLLPYIYGVPQLIQPGILTGRLTSIFFSVAGLALWLRIAQRHGGGLAVALAALLLGTYTFGIYLQSIAKYFALVSFLFAATLSVLTSKGEWRYFFATVFAILASLVRLSALAFAVPITIYCFVTCSQKSVRFAIVLFGAAIVVLLILFFAPNPQATEWNLLSHHLGQWGSLAPSEKVEKILFSRVPGVIASNGPFVFLSVVTLVLFLLSKEDTQKVGGRVSCHLPVWVFGAGLALFAVSHFAAGGFYLDYFVPAIVAFLPLLSIAIAKVLSSFSGRTWRRSFLEFAFIGTLVFAWARGDLTSLRQCGEVSQVEGIRRISSFVARNSSPQDRIIALEALWIAVESNRVALPGLAMSEFSYQRMGTPEAKALQLVNGDILLDYIVTQRARVIALTEFDWLMLGETGYDDRVREALERNYELKRTRLEFGQWCNRLDVYVSR